MMRISKKDRWRSSATVHLSPRSFRVFANLHRGQYQKITDTSRERPNRDLWMGQTKLPQTFVDREVQRSPMSLSVFTMLAQSQNYCRPLCRPPPKFKLQENIQECRTCSGQQRRHGGWKKVGDGAVQPIVQSAVVIARSSTATTTVKRSNEYYGIPRHSILVKTLWVECFDTL